MSEVFRWTFWINGCPWRSAVEEGQVESWQLQRRLDAAIELLLQEDSGRG